MAKIFVSYSRADRTFIDQFIPLIRRVYGNDSVWFDYDIHGGMDWWQMILDEIGKCDLFVYLISNESLESPYCQAELREALRLNKPILPVIVRRLKPAYPGNIDADLADILRRTQFVDMSGGFRDPDTLSTLYATLNRLLDDSSQPAVTPTTTTPTPQPPVPDKQPSNDSTVKAAYIAGGFALLAAIVAGLFGLWQGVFTDDDDTPTPPQPTTAVAQNPTATPTLSPLEIAQATQTQDAIDFQLTLDAADATEAAVERLTATAFAPTQEAQLQATVDAILTATRTAQLTENAPTLTTTINITVVPVIEIEEELPTARILLDPGLNLHLRRLPNSNSVSLDLAPSGSIVFVNGREGAPIDLNGDEIIGEGEEAFTDPATLLADNNEDLNPEETWVNLTFLRPDGIEITAWTPAVYLDIQTPSGEAQRLADLELIPANRVGEVIINSVAVTNRLDPNEIAAFTPVTNNAEWTPVERDFDSVTMVLVPAGSFEMGSTDDEIDFAFEMCQQAVDNDAECQRSWIDDEAQNGDNTQTFSQPFWIDRTEVTRAQYQACVDAEACEETPESDFSSDNDQPINRVTWFQAQAYCEWRGGRLPTEAEWEYAARGPDRLIFPWGNVFDGTLANHCDSNCGNTDWASSFNYVNEENDDGFEITAPVGSFPDGASWVGALDMAGNVWEWTSSLYDQDNFPYPYAADDGRERDTGDSTDVRRVVRGSSFPDSSNYLRAADRGVNPPNDADANVGFRCVRSVANTGDTASD